MVKQIVQTDTFAGFLQERLVRGRLEGIGITLGFKNFEISLFPLETTVTKISFALPGQGVGGTFETISFGVDFSDLLLNRLTISEMKASGGRLTVEQRERGGGSDKGFVVSEGLEDIDRIVSGLPFRVGKISFNDALIQTEYLDGSVKNIELSYGGGGGGIHIVGECENVKLKEDYGWKGDIGRIRLSARANSRRVVFENLFVQVGENDISTQGHFLVADRSYEGNIQGKLFLESLEEDISLKNKDIFRSIKGGELRFDGSFKTKNGVAFDGNFHVRNFRSSYGNFRNMETNASLVGNRLNIKNVDITTESGGTLSIEGETYFDFRSKDHNLRDVLVRLDKVKTAEALAFLRGRLDPLDAVLTGTVGLSLDDEDIMHFVLGDGFRLDAPRLVFKNLKVLSFDRLDLEQTYFRYDLRQHRFSLDTRFALGGEELVAEGYVDREAVDIGFRRGDVDFGFIKNIAGVKVGGVSRLDFRVSGPLDDVEIRASGRGVGMLVDKYFLGNGDFGLVYHINANVLRVDNFKSKDPESRFSAKGSFDFSRTKDNSMELDIDVNKMSFLAAKKSFGIHIPKLIRNIDGLNFLFSGKASLKLDFWKGVDSILVQADLASVTYFGEVAPVGRFELSVDDKDVYIRNSYLKKGRGEIAGTLHYGISKKNLEYDFRIRDINLDSFYFYRRADIGLDGRIDGYVRGKGSEDSVNSDILLKLADARISNRRIAGPEFRARFDSNEASIGWNILGDRVKGDAYLNFKDRKKPSTVKVDMAVDNLTPLFAMFSKHNNAGEFGGRLYANFNSSFYLGDMLRPDVDLRVSGFSLDYGKGRVLLSDGASGINIAKGRIKSWNMGAEGGVNVLSSSGSGNLSGKFEVVNNYTFDPKLLGIFFGDITHAEGRIIGRTTVSGSREGIRHSSRLSAKGISIAHRNLPGSFEGVDFNIAADDERIVIDKMSGSYSRGDFAVSGVVGAGFPYPSIDIDVDFTNINYAMFSRSNLIASGKVGLTGMQPPYRLGGRVVVDKVLFLDSLTELTKGVNQTYVYSKYLPKRQSGLEDGWMVFDLGISSKNSVEIKTNIVDAILSSSLSVKGNQTTPLLTGRATIAPKVSRIFFKGQEFVIEGGRIDFRDAASKQAPFIRLEGSSVVDRYRILLSIVGNTDNLTIDLQSEPALAQKDILSLMTLGYTSDVSDSLDENQRQFLTTMSLGGFLIDQLRIGQGLNDRVGFRLSVAPEFNEEDEDLIENRTSERRQIRKLRSSTKVTLESNIGRKTNVSISSSLGAEDEQAQGLKVNYNINENVSVQGVYENIMEDNQTQQTNSVGGDLKFQWIFGG